jgi:hypothetical protein
MAALTAKVSNSAGSEGFLDAPGSLVDPGEGLGSLGGKALHVAEAAVLLFGAEFHGSDFFGQDDPCLAGAEKCGQERDGGDGFANLEAYAGAVADGF